MATGGDHDPFFDDLSDIPDGSSAGTGFGWGEGLAAESSLRDLSTRLFSAAFSRARSGAPSPPIENPSEPRFEAPLYDIFCRCELPVRAADASPVRVFYNDVTVLGGFPTKPLLKVLHPDPSCTVVLALILPRCDFTSQLCVADVTALCFGTRRSVR